MTREELSKAFPPIPLSSIDDGLKKAKAFVESEEQRVFPHRTDDYDNSTSDEVYDVLVKQSDAKEAKLSNLGS